MLDGVLRGEHEKGVWQFVALAGGGHGALLHGLEEGRLCLGRRSVDFVSEDDVGEQGSLVELEPALLVENLGTDDVARHQVRRELDAVEAEAEGLTWIFEASMSIVFIADLILSFNTAYLEDGEWVLSHQKIISRFERTDGLLG